MQVREQVVEILRVEWLSRHQVAAVQDGCGYAIVIGGGARRERRLLVQGQQSGAVARLIHAVVVALRAARLKELVAVRLLCVQLVQRRGRGHSAAAGKHQRANSDE